MTTKQNKTKNEKKVRGEKGGGEEVQTHKMLKGKTPFFLFSFSPLVCWLVGFAFNQTVDNNCFLQLQILTMKVGVSLTQKR